MTPGVRSYIMTFDRIFRRTPWRSSNRTGRDVLAARDLLGESVSLFFSRGKVAQ